jgi:GNAT superfamily N-acetyltransferase
MSTFVTIIRRALATDAESIAGLYHELVANPNVLVLPDRLTQVNQDPSTGLFVATQNDVVRGTALVSLCADVMFGSQPFAVVENIIVSKDSRSMGVGMALLRHVEAFCITSQCSKIMLLSSARRVEAHRFFEREGFTGSSKIGFVKYRRDFQGT